MPTPIYLSNTCRVNLRTFRREIDTVLDNESLKEQSKKNKLFQFLSAVKSFVKKEWTYTHHITLWRISTTLNKWNFIDIYEFGGFLMVKDIICLEIGNTR